jgi:hypothetical protein
VRLSPWQVSIGLIAFGDAGAAVYGYMLLFVLIAVAIGCLIVLALHRTYRRCFPKRGKVNECSPELLAQWKPVSDWMRAHPGQSYFGRQH